MASTLQRPPPSRAALVWLIRGTYLITAIFCVLWLLFVLIVPLAAFLKNITDVTNPWGYRLTLVLFELALILAYGFVLKRNLHNIRNFFTIEEADAAANFAVVFGLLLALDWYYLLPVVPCRGVLAVGVFLLFSKLIKAYLKQVLGLNDPRPPQNPPGDRHIPEFPQKSPLLPL